MEIEELNIDLTNTSGWNNSGGQSENVWGQVPFPQKLIDLAGKSRLKPSYLAACMMLNQIPNRYAPVWSAYDKALYSNDRTERENLPKTISATFKSCFKKYSAIAENMGMNIAIALDMPTSYNYIVKFDPAKHPDIVRNYSNDIKRSTVDRLGIVSIDFLQSIHTSTPTVEQYKDVDEAGNSITVASVDDVDGDVLISFDDIVQKRTGSNNNLDGGKNLIKNWIDAVDSVISSKLVGAPQERINKTYTDTHSRMARAFLLKEYLGDCDNASYNAALVFNRTAKTLRYAPTFDYGECFNKLIRTKLDKQRMPQQQFEALPPRAKEAMLARWKKEDAESVADIACQFAGGEVSKQNLAYIFENFPVASLEFFVNIETCTHGHRFDEIVDQYTKMTCDGVPIMTEAESAMFKEYLSRRADWMCEMYQQYLNAKTPSYTR